MMRSLLTTGMLVFGALAALSGSGLTPASSRTKTGGEAQTAGEWTPQAFPISFWCGPPPEYITVPRYKEIAAAGFNYVMPPCEGAATPELNRKILDTARAAGLKAFLSDSRMPLSITGTANAVKNLDAIVADYAKHPAFAGYHLTDEPNANAFAGLGEVVAYLRKRDPKHPAFINLFPNYASPEQLGTPTYETYLSRYLQTVHPFALSYDHYHFLKDGDRPGFFANLLAARQAVKDSTLPFWQIVLAIPHGPYRPLTEAEKRWEAMQTLAYGGKGLMYFTYWTPGDSSFDWGPALMKRDGTATPQYEEVKRINKDVQTIGKYLLNAIPSGVFQTGKLAPGGIPREQGTPVVFPDAGDVTVGLFRADTHLYVLFTNRDYKQTTETDVLLSNGLNPVEKLNKSNGKWETVKGEKTPDGDFKARLSLAAGDGELYRW